MGEFVPRPKTLGGESNLETPVKTQADGAPLFRIEKNRNALIETIYGDK